MNAPQFSIENGKARTATEGFSVCHDEPSPGLTRVDFDDGLILETGHAQMNKVSEGLAVHEKRRFNASRGGERIAFVMRGVVPFGSEPAVTRDVSVSGSSIRFVTEFELRHSFAMEKLDAGTVSVSGPIARVGVVEAPKKGAAFPAPAWQDFESFEEVELKALPMAVIVESSSGSFLELSGGEDLWRWTAAERHGGHCRFSLKKDKNALRFEREIFFLKGPEPTPVPGWTWRLEWTASWSRGKPEKSRKRKFKASFDMAAEKWPEAALCVVGGKTSELPCLASSAVLNILKKWVRQQLAGLAEGDVLALTNVEPSYCESASHQGRPKLEELPHWGLEPLLEFREWADKQLAASGASLLLIPGAKSKALALPSLSPLK